MSKLYEAGGDPSNLGFSADELISAGASEDSWAVKSSQTARQEVVEEIAASTEELANAARSSLDFLAGLAMPLIYKYAFPPVFLAVWQWLTSYVQKTRDFSQLALGLPRGFGKTIVIKLFILWCILFTQKKFILILCETQSKANNIIADIIDTLEEPNIKKIFGDWKLGVEIDRQDLKKFGFRGRNIILMGAGAGSGIRGITLKNERPDVMIFDDVQSRECADSQIQSEALEQWLVGTAMKAKSPHGCLFIFVANMYPTKWSILKHLKDNPNWIKFIAGGILEDGTSLWEDLQPIAQLKRELINDLSMGRASVFFSEVLNDENASSNDLIDLSLLPPLPYKSGDIPAGNFVVIDPATGKIGSDNVVVAYCEVFDGYPVMRKVKSDTMSPGECIRVALTFCLEHNCRLVAIEGVAYQATLSYWFQFICTQMGISGIECIEVYPGGFSKNSRILKMLKSYAAGELFIDPEARPLAHLEIVQFNPLRTDNTDNILDCLCYMPKVIEMAGEFIVNMSIIQAQEYQALEVADVSVTSPF